ncbi:MAG: hypothetical protein NVSMB52_01220 [Chloroflexota bacterium]
MLILGMIVGPAIGLLSGDLLSRFGGHGLWRNLITIALFLTFVVFAPFFVLELKIGLVFGTLIGLLVAATPFRDAVSEIRET